MTASDGARRTAWTSNRTLWAWTAGTFFGVGLLKPGPGTWGSVAATLVWLAFAQATHAGAVALATATAIAAAVALAIGIPAANIICRESGREDPQMVVLDEVVGQWIALLPARPDWAHAILALIFFRIFDILKPPPARQFDRMHGGLGVMLDDVAAGGYALLCVLAVQHFF